MDNHVLQRKGRGYFKYISLKFLSWALICVLVIQWLFVASGAAAQPQSALQGGSFTASGDPLFPSIPWEGDTRLQDHPTLPAALTGTSAQSAVLINADSGDILFRQNESAELPMASTTKIMTALVAIESLPLDASITVTSDAVGVEGSSIYLTEGETLTLEDLLYAMMLESANDAAVAIAVAVSGSVDAFADKMNQRASALGLQHTHFTNPHGLDDPEHYTTALELALITQAALSHDDLATIMSTQRKTIPHKNADSVRLLLNHNKLLRSYEGAIGVKTGFTKKSGRCLVSAAKRDGVSLIAVTIKAPDDWRDHTAMLDYGFSLYDTVELCPVGAFNAPLWVVGGATEYVMVKNTDALTLALPKNHGHIRCVVELPRFVFAPVATGDQLGRLVFYESNSDGEWQYLADVPLYAQHDVHAEVYKKSLFEKISEFFGF